MITLHNKHIEHQDTLYRDERSGAIINRNKKDLEEYKSLKRQRNEVREMSIKVAELSKKICDLDNRIEHLQAYIEEIKK
jgi:peptidoglycan hydrolase CwlO-like protein